MSKLPSYKIDKNYDSIHNALVENHDKSPCVERYSNGCRLCASATWKWLDSSAINIEYGGRCWKDERYPSGDLVVTCDALSKLTQHGGPTCEFNASYQEFDYDGSIDALTITGSYPGKKYVVVIQFT